MGSYSVVEGFRKLGYVDNGQPGDIINQYVVFTQVCNEQVKKYGRTKKAIEETIRICKAQNVLKEYLETREKEVINIMVALYDEQEVMDRYVANRVNNEKKENAKAIARNMIAVGKMTYEEIANCTGLSVIEVEKLDSSSIV